MEVEEGMEWRLDGFAAEVLSDEYRDSIPVADVGVMPKHYEVRLGCYHLESSGANAAVEGVEHGEEREEAAVAPSTSAEGVVGPVKAHASVPSLVSGPALGLRHEISYYQKSFEEYHTPAMHSAMVGRHAIQRCSVFGARCATANSRFHVSVKKEHPS